MGSPQAHQSEVRKVKKSKPEDDAANFEPKGWRAVWPKQSFLATRAGQKEGVEGGRLGRGKTSEASCKTYNP